MAWKCSESVHVCSAPIQSYVQQRNIDSERYAVQISNQLLFVLQSSFSLLVIYLRDVGQRINDITRVICILLKES